MSKKTNLLRELLLCILIVATVLFNTSCSADDFSEETNPNTSNIGLEYVDTIMGYTVDYGDCILVKYKYTNTQTTDSCFEWTFDINAYQNGIRLEHAYPDGLDLYGDLADYANNNLDTIVAPGTTITICEVFKLNDNISDITINASESFNTEVILTDVIEPLSLIPPLELNHSYCYDDENHWFYIVEYSFTNTSDIPKSFDEAFDVYAITFEQNDGAPITLERSSNITTALSNRMDISSYDLLSSQETIDSGEEIDVYLLFEIETDTTSEYEDLEVSIYEKNTDDLVWNDYIEDTDLDYF